MISNQNKSKLLLLPILICSLFLILFFSASGIARGVSLHKVPNQQLSSMGLLSQNQDTSTERIALYRLYNPNSGEHFYTSTTKEREGLVTVGWSDEGVAWMSPKSSKTPVYRLYNPVEGDHHYTTNLEEYNALAEAGWKKEGEGWYSAEEESASKVKILRQYNPYATTGTHNFTKNESENNYLVSIGWKYEGVAWYGYDDTKKTIDFSKVNINANNITFTGSQVKPKVSIEGLVEGTDYTLTYSNNVNAGTASVNIKGKNSYTGEKSFDFKILPKEISILGISVSKPYDGTKTASTTNSAVQFTKIADGDIILNNDVSIDYITGEFNDANAANDKNITLKVKLKGNDASNYTVKDINTKGTIKSVVKFVTNCNTNLEDQSVNFGNCISDPSTQLKLDGKAFAGWYSDSLLTSAFDAKNTPITANEMTLYAKWDKRQEAGEFWLSTAASKDPENTYDTNYKNSTTISNDVKAIKDVSASNHDEIVQEYTNYMNNDNVHLYAQYNDDSIEDKSNNLVEFRIIEVGKHDGDEALTFMATHTLAQNESMCETENISSGWGSENNTLRNSLQEGGSIYSKFSTELTSSISKVKKKYNISSSAQQQIESNTSLFSLKNALLNANQAESNNEDSGVTTDIEGKCEIDNYAITIFYGNGKDFLPIYGANVRLLDEKTYGRTRLVITNVADLTERDIKIQVKYKDTLEGVSDMEIELFENNGEARGAKLTNNYGEDTFQYHPFLTNEDGETKVKDQFNKEDEYTVKVTSYESSDNIIKNTPTIKASRYQAKSLVEVPVKEATVCQVASNKFKVLNADSIQGKNVKVNVISRDLNGPINGAQVTFVQSDGSSRTTKTLDDNGSAVFYADQKTNGDAFWLLSYDEIVDEDSANYATFAPKLEGKQYAWFKNNEIKPSGSFDCLNLKTRVQSTNGLSSNEGNIWWLRTIDTTNANYLGVSSTGSLEHANSQCIGGNNYGVVLCFSF